MDYAEAHLEPISMILPWRMTMSSRWNTLR